jgi:hypothetical protein
LVFSDVRELKGKMHRNNGQPGIRTLVSARAAAVAAVALALGSPVSYAMEKGTYQPPDLNTFLLINSEDADGDGDGVKETHVMHYQNVAGDKLFSMTTKDKVWAWSLKTPEDAARNSAWNYVIRDSNCDGVFDEKYKLDEEFHVPDCLK